MRLLLGVLIALTVFEAGAEDTSNDTDRSLNYWANSPKEQQYALYSLIPPPYFTNGRPTTNYLGLSSVDQRRAHRQHCMAAHNQAYLDAYLYDRNDDVNEVAKIQTNGVIAVGGDVGYSKMISSVRTLAFAGSKYGMDEIAVADIVWRACLNDPKTYGATIDKHNEGAE
jgi:hypothetical protein